MPATRTVPRAQEIQAAAPVSPVYVYEEKPAVAADRAQFHGTVPTVSYQSEPVPNSRLPVSDYSNVGGGGGAGGPAPLTTPATATRSTGATTLRTIAKFAAIFVACLIGLVLLGIGANRLQQLATGEKNCEYDWIEWIDGWACAMSRPNFTHVVAKYYDFGRPRSIAMLVIGLLFFLGGIVAAVVVGLRTISAAKNQRRATQTAQYSVPMKAVESV